MGGLYNIINNINNFGVLRGFIMFGNIYRMAGTRVLPRQRIMDCTKKMKSITRKAKQLIERRNKMTKRVIQSVKKWQTKYKTTSADMEKKNKQLTNEFYKQYEYCQNIKKRNPNDEDLTNMVSILTDEKFDFDTSNLSKGEENFIDDFVKI